jgi:hypothetical protein
MVIKMSLTHIPDELINKIWKFIDCDKTLNVLFKICKKFRKISIEYNWPRSIKINRNTFIPDFIHFYTTTNILIDVLLIEGLDSICWLQDIPFPKKIIFERCKIDNNFLNVTTEQITEILIIEDLHRNKMYEPIYINWTMFPRLKMLDIYAPDINFDGLENCKDLEVVRIDLDKEKELPKFFEKFQNLSLFATSCFASEPFHFVSKKIKGCFILKSHKFTSESSLVPESHLDVDFRMNIQSIEL